MNSRQALDGLWEFLPVRGRTDGERTARRDIPQSGYEATPIQVPGYWNMFPESVGGNWGAYDHYGYPSHWNNAEAGWYRLRFRAEPQVGGVVANSRSPAGGGHSFGAGRAGCGCRVRLRFDAVAGESAVWLNGEHLGGNVDSFLPFSFDVTETLRLGAQNELTVFVGPPPKVGDLWLAPCGSWVGWHLRGIWQSVYLETSPLPAIEDVFPQPSVRDDRLTVEVTVARAIQPVEAELRVTVCDRNEPVLDLGRQLMRTGDSGSRSTRFTANGPGLRHWSPEHPQLYHARAELWIDGILVHKRSTRFGFREFWVEGTGFRLDGEPIRLFGDSWHYMGAAQQNPAYARTWFDLARRTGANAIRTHAMPYPPFYFDIADELGMLIIDESAVYGSAGTLAYGERQFWENSREHVRRLVRRDRHHPSIIFWSVCNETVWKGGEAIYDDLLSLADQARQSDPTRFVSFDENDCDLGGRALLHAGHYGTPQHWDRAWKRDRPLVVHEFSTLYHGGPESASPVGNDRVYADYPARLAAAGEDAAEMFLRLRSLGAASITPWNINWYCLEPIPVRAVEAVPPATTRGGAPIRRIGPRALTLNYGYAAGKRRWNPNPAYRPLAACYKRRRFFLRRRPKQAFAGQRIKIEAELWNDCDEAVTVTLSLRLSGSGGSHTTDSRTVRMERYVSAQATVPLLVPGADDDRRYTAELSMTIAAGGETLHVESWTVYAHASFPRVPDSRRAAWIIGSEHRAPDLLERFGLEPVTGPDPADSMYADRRTTLLLAGDNAGRTLASWLARPEVDRWLRRGGRLVVLPDGTADDTTCSLTPIRKSCDRAYRRGGRGGLLRGLTDQHFHHWGDDGIVARTVFQRPSTGPALTPLDVGDAAEGLTYAPLVVVPIDRGHVITCGMDLVTRAADTPAAAILLQRLLHDDLPKAPTKPVIAIGETDYAHRPLFDETGVANQAVPEPVSRAESRAVVICDGASTAVLDDPRTSKQRIDELLAAGGTLFVDALTPETAPAWAQRLDVPLTLQQDVRYNVAWACRGSLSAGLNNFDLCWVNRDDKQPIVRYTLDVSPAAYRTLVHTVATRWEDYQTTAEQHKVAMMYRRLESFPGPRAAAVELRRRRGRIVISQLLLHEAQGAFRPRARRILSRWLDATGAARADSVSPLTPRPRQPVNADGYITDWLVLGPFAGGQGHPLDHAFVDEADLRPADGMTIGPHAWQRVSSAFPQIDLSRAFEHLPEADRVAYAAIYVHAPQDRSVLLDAPDMLSLLTGSDGGLKVLLNGVAVGRFDFVRELVLDADRVDALPLRTGWNTLLIKLHNPSGPWQFSARLVTAGGEPAGDLEYRLDA